MKAVRYINKSFGYFSVCTMIFALTLAGYTASAEDSSSEVTEQVLDHHLAAFGSLAL